MFNSNILTSSKGPLGAIWVAAYGFKKLKETQVCQTNIAWSVDEILKVELDVATFRILAYFLLGVVKIFSKKVDYVIDFCRNLITEVNDRKIKKLLESLQKPCNSITLPKSFELDAFDLEVLEEDNGENLVAHEKITLKDSASKMVMEQYSLSKFSYEQFDVHNHESSADNAPMEDILSSQVMEIVMCVSPSHRRNLKTGVEKVQGLGFSSEEWVTVNTFYADEEELVEPIKPASEDFDMDEELIELTIKRLLEKEVGGETVENLKDDHFLDIGEEPVRLLEYYAEDEACLETEVCQIMEEDDIIVQPSTKELNDHPSLEDVTANMEKSWEPEEKMAEPVKTSSGEHLSDDAQVKKSSVDGKHQLTSGGVPLSVAVVSTPKSKLPDRSGTMTTESIGVRTPAALERPRGSRKRKHLIDDMSVIPNGEMKRRITEARDLVSKRRKVPHTALATWRASIMSSLPNGFLAPLLPHISSELRPLFLQKKLSVAEVVEMVNPSEQESPFQETAIASETLVEPTNFAPKTPIGRSRDPAVVVVPETPVSHSVALELCETPPQGHEKSLPNTIGGDCSSQAEKMNLNEGPEFDLDLLNEEKGLAGADTPDPHGFSARTRIVGKCLQRIFEKQREKREDEAVNLSRLAKGKRKKESARLFYEILVLKTKGYVDIKQDEPFDDILVRKVPKWDQICGASS